MLPSFSLLYRPTSALSKLQIHLPIPLDPRESRRLLDLLSKSFRQQLDKEHPSFPSDTDYKAPASVHRHDAPATPNPRRPSLTDLERRPVERHFKSVLENPLFALAVRQGTGRQHDSNPMDTFDQAVSIGMMTTHHAAVCLKAEMRRIIASSALDVEGRMRDSGAGLKVLKWLCSSGVSRDMNFLEDANLMPILISFMVADGTEEVLGCWTKMSFDRYKSHLSSGQVLTGASDSLLLTCLVEETSKRWGKSLDIPYLHISRAAGYLNGCSVAEKRILRKPLIKLFNSTVRSRIFRPAPSEANFESFMSLIPILGSRAEYCSAYLGVLHPTKPSADAAMDLLRTRDPFRSSPGSAKQYIRLALDAAKLLFEQNRHSQAREVMEYLRTHHPRELGINRVRQVEQARAEAASLEMLQGLSLA